MNGRYVSLTPFFSASGFGARRSATSAGNVDFVHQCHVRSRVHGFDHRVRDDFADAFERNALFDAVRRLEATASLPARLRMPLPLLAHRWLRCRSRRRRLRTPSTSSRVMRPFLPVPRHLGDCDALLSCELAHARRRKHGPPLAGCAAGAGAAAAGAAGVSAAGCCSRLALRIRTPVAHCRCSRRRSVIGCGMALIRHFAFRFNDRHDLANVTNLSVFGQHFDHFTVHRTRNFNDRFIVLYFHNDIFVCYRIARRDMHFDDFAFMQAFTKLWEPIFKSMPRS